MWEVIPLNKFELKKSKLVSEKSKVERNEYISKYLMKPDLGVKQACFCKKTFRAML